MIETDQGYHFKDLLNAKRFCEVVPKLIGDIRRVVELIDYADQQRFLIVPHRSLALPRTVARTCSGVRATRSAKKATCTPHS